MHSGEALDHLPTADEMLRRAFREPVPVDRNDQANGKSRKILIYSSDSFSMGHLRQCQTIANSLVGTFDTLSVLILSGSPIIGRFEFPSRVDFVRVPGLARMNGDDPVPPSLLPNVEHAVQIRSTIIQKTAEAFEPDIFIVDKNPHGLCGEVLPTLNSLKETDTHLVLGLRDVVDDPSALQREWNEQDIRPTLENLYSEIWVHGASEICNPLEGLDLPASVSDKVRYTGYLRRRLPEGVETAHRPGMCGKEPYILVQPGDDGRSVELVEWVLQAYETRTKHLPPALVILPPFMPASSAAGLVERARCLPDVSIIGFTPQPGPLLANAAAVVGMGDYNTFCEILSCDKPALLVNPVATTAEQTIRTELAELRGLVKLLAMDEDPAPGLLADALAALPEAPRPSSAGIQNLLGGLDVIGERVDRIFASGRTARLDGNFKQALKPAF